MPKTPSPPPTAPEDESPTTIVLRFKPEALDSYRDLQANAHLKRQTPESLLAKILEKATGHAFTITPLNG